MKSCISKTQASVLNLEANQKWILLVKQHLESAEKQQD